MAVHRPAAGVLDAGLQELAGTPGVDVVAVGVRPIDLPIAAVVDPVITGAFRLPLDGVGIDEVAHVDMQGDSGGSKGAYHRADIIAGRCLIGRVVKFQEDIGDVRVGAHQRQVDLGREGVIQVEPVDLPVVEQPVPVAVGCAGRDPEADQRLHIVPELTLCTGCRRCHVPGPRPGDRVDEDGGLVAGSISGIPFVIIIKRVELIVAKWVATCIVVPDRERDRDQRFQLIGAYERDIGREAEVWCEGPRVNVDCDVVERVMDLTVDVDCHIQIRCSIVEVTAQIRDA